MSTTHSKSDEPARVDGVVSLLTNHRYLLAERRATGASPRTVDKHRQLVCAPSSP